MPSKNTKKKLKESAKSQQPAKEIEVTETQENQVSAETQVEETVKPVEKQKIKTKKKEKKPSKIKKTTKEVFSELKKVTWPTAKQVAKKTGVVLVVVLFFAVVLLGIHKLLEVIYTWFLSGLV